jgi:phosphoribosylglycinamide formyltransferase-1
VLVSGGGTTLQAIIDAIMDQALPAEIALVVSSRREVMAPERARKHGIPVTILRPRDFITVEEYDSSLCETLLAVRPDLIVLAGYLSILGEKVLASFAGRIMNIHPSLLPAFGGKGCYGQRVHKQVLDYGCKVSGATVMFVDTDVDTGPIILQKAVPVLDTDTVDSLAKRVAEVEWELYPQAIALFAEGRLQSDGRRVKILQEVY